jgi:hypothetical protein
MKIVVICWYLVGLANMAPAPPYTIGQQREIFQEPLSSIYRQGEIVQEPFYSDYDQTQIMQEPAFYDYEQTEIIQKPLDYDYGEPDIIQEPLDYVYEQREAIPKPIDHNYEQPEIIQEPVYADNDYFDQISFNINIDPNNFFSGFPSNFNNNNNRNNFPNFGSDSFPGLGGSSFSFSSNSSNITPSLDSSFGSNGNNNGSRRCGLLCQLFKTSFGDVGTSLDNIGNVVVIGLQDDKNDVGIAKPDEGYDLNNTTYIEKVLPDGTVVRTNKTVIADTDDNGNSFFFQSSVHHNIGSGNPDDDAENDVSDNQDSDLVEIVEEENGDMETVDESVENDELSQELLEADVEGSSDEEEFSAEDEIETANPLENEIEQITLPTLDVRDLFE